MISTNEILSFIKDHIYFTAAMLILNLIIARKLAVRLNLNRHTIEAAGRRKKGPVYKSRMASMAWLIKRFKRMPVEQKLKKAGYTGEYSAFIYLLLKYAAPSILYIASLLNSYGIVASFIPALAFMGGVELYVHSRKRSINLRFEKNAYRIYKFLHNQVSSGIKVTDAIMAVHEAVEDTRLKDILVRLAARFSLTLDIDETLEEFKEYFDAKEAHTLCAALKQGVETGDNRELLAAQEDEMFNMYFNYIQAETNNCQVKSVIAAVAFTAIIVIMICVPMYGDLMDGISKIFVN